MIRSEKIIWIFFAATSCQLAFQHPSFLLVAGDRSNLFSGLLAFLTLMVAVLCWRIFNFLTGGSFPKVAGFSTCSSVLCL